VLDYRVPPEYATALAEFDGSVVVERTAGEISARCHDEQANNLALNLANDIVTDAMTVEEAREYYAKEFLDHRRKQATPYMDALRFRPDGATRDADERVLSDQDLERAVEEGKGTERPRDERRLERRRAARLEPAPVGESVGIDRRGR
jgi:hypothetical protein